MGLAQAGDTIKLAAWATTATSGISGKSFASDLTITSADPTHAAVFGSLSIQSSSGVHVDDVNITYVPTTATLSFSSAVQISASHGITITGGVIVGGPAVNGVPQNATLAQLDADVTGNVIGLPSARAMTIYASSDVTIHGTDISQFDRGVILQDATQTTLDDNNIHDLRRTAISGTGDNLTITNNNLHDAHPWRWGDTAGGGDHADFIALCYRQRPDPGRQQHRHHRQHHAPGRRRQHPGHVDGGQRHRRLHQCEPSAATPSSWATTRASCCGDVVGGTVANNDPGRAQPAASQSPLHHPAVGEGRQTSR